MLGPVRFVPQRWITVMDCLYLSTNWESKPVSSTYHKLWFWKYGNVLKIRNRFRWAQILSEDVGGEGRVAGGSMGHISWARTLSKSRRRRVKWRDWDTNCEQEFCKKKGDMKGSGHILWARVLQQQKKCYGGIGTHVVSLQGKKKEAVGVMEGSAHCGMKRSSR